MSKFRFPVRHEVRHYVSPQLLPTINYSLCVCVCFLGVSKCKFRDVCLEARYVVMLLLGLVFGVGCTNGKCIGVYFSLCVCLGTDSSSG